MRNLIAITNRNLYTIDYFEQIKRIVDMSPESLILREKGLTVDEYDYYASRVNRICGEADVDLYIHTHIDIARKYSIKNIHMPVSVIQTIKDDLSDFDNISVSCHSKDDVITAKDLGATRIILGTVFETDCKPGLKGAGLDFVRSITSITKLPVYAIGGINESNIESVIEAGAAGGCMMSGFASK